MRVGGTCVGTLRAINNNPDRPVFSRSRGTFTPIHKAAALLYTCYAAHGLSGYEKRKRSLCCCVQDMSCGVARVDLPAVCETLRRQAEERAQAEAEEMRRQKEEEKQQGVGHPKREEGLLKGRVRQMAQQLLLLLLRQRRLLLPWDALSPPRQQQRLP